MEVQRYKSIEQFARVKEFMVGQQVVIQEKLDGSNVAIGKTAEGEYWYQSRNNIIDVQAPGLFARFIEWVQSQQRSSQWDEFLGPWVAYGETLNTNKLKYEDAQPFVLFDMYFPTLGCWAGVDEIRLWATVLGCVAAPVLFEGTFGPEHTTDNLRALIAQSRFDSRSDFLAEGIVIKAYNCDRWYYDDGVKKVVNDPLIAGKLVRADISETKTPRKDAVDPLDKIAETFFTPARFDKALQKLREAGTPLDRPNLLMREVMTDIHSEEAAAIKDMLFNLYWKAISSKLQKLTLNEYNERQLSS